MTEQPEADPPVERVGEVDEADAVERVGEVDEADAADAADAVHDQPVEFVPQSGDPRVQAALQRLGELADTAPPEHVEIYEDVHRTLQEVLAEAGRQDGAPGAGDARR
jgi:hypothetical protein